MKHLLFISMLGALLISQFAMAQSFKPENQHANLDMLLTAHQSVSRQQSTNLDKLQRETEELLITLLPASVISLGHLINEKFESVKTRKSIKKLNRKKENCSV